MKDQVGTKEIGQDVLYRVLQLKDGTPVGVIISVDGEQSLAAKYFKRIPGTTTSTELDMASSALWDQLLPQGAFLSGLVLTGVFAEHLQLGKVVQQTIAGGPEGALHDIYVDAVLQPNGIADSEDLVYMPAAA